VVNFGDRRNLERGGAKTPREKKRRSTGDSLTSKKTAQASGGSFESSLSKEESENIEMEVYYDHDGAYRLRTKKKISLTGWEKREGTIKRKKRDRAQLHRLEGKFISDRGKPISRPKTPDGSQEYLRKEQDCQKKRKGLTVKRNPDKGGGVQQMHYSTQEVPSPLEEFKSGNDRSLEKD